MFRQGDLDSDSLGQFYVTCKGLGWASGKRLHRQVRVTL